jgi:hypothetical protein
MGINGIGKPGSPVAPTSTGATLPAASTEGPPFAERMAETSATNRAEGPQSALTQLHAGAITVDQYLDLKVQEATAPLGLAPAQLESMRAALRERLSADPTLVDLVRAATGAVEIPAPPRDE